MGFVKLMCECVMCDLALNQNLICHLELKQMTSTTNVMFYYSRPYVFKLFAFSFRKVLDLFFYILLVHQTIQNYAPNHLLNFALDHTVLRLRKFCRFTLGSNPETATDSSHTDTQTCTKFLCNTISNIFKVDLALILAI